MDELDRIKREKRRAVLLSVIPGLGQIANRQPRKFGFYFPSTVIAIAVGAAILWVGNAIGPTALRRGDGLWFMLGALVGVLVAVCAIVLGLYFWASSAVDCFHSARARQLGTDEDERWWFFRF